MWRRIIIIFRKKKFSFTKKNNKIYTYEPLYYIHSYGILPRDLKPENILITSNDENTDLKILDFDLSKIIKPNGKTKEPYCTLSYVAPEVLLDISYGKEFDLWSPCVITYLMLSG